MRRTAVLAAALLLASCSHYTPFVLSGGPESWAFEGTAANAGTAGFAKMMPARAAAYCESRGLVMKPGKLTEFRGNFIRHGHAVYEFKCEQPPA